MLQVVVQEELHGDALTTRQAEPPLVQQETHPAEHTLCLGVCGRNTQELPGQSHQRRILLLPAPPPAQRILVSFQSGLVSVPER